MRRTKRAFGVFVIATVLVVGPAAFVALAKGHGSHTASATTIDVVNVDPLDSTVNYGDTITFSVTTSATRPFVQLSCFQAGDLVYSKSAGFFADYSFSNTYTLSSSYWSGGAADCTATAYYFTSTGREQVLTTLDFPVAA
jgi:hypothetical protein